MRFPSSPHQGNDWSLLARVMGIIYSYVTSSSTSVPTPTPTQWWKRREGGKMYCFTAYTIENVPEIVAPQVYQPKFRETKTSKRRRREPSPLFLGILARKSQSFLA